MKLQKTNIAGLVVLTPKFFSDERGWFMESFNEEGFAKELSAVNLTTPNFVQENHSMSHKGVVRGLHYQNSPHAQGKLVRVVQGRVWDVAVDIRLGSPTYGKWFGIELSAENKKLFWIPEGFAHGFIALEDNTQFLYKATAYYDKESEGSLMWNDPSLNIEWPLDQVDEIKVSEKDRLALSFEDYKA